MVNNKEQAELFLYKLYQVDLDALDKRSAKAYAREAKQFSPAIDLRADNYGLVEQIKTCMAYLGRELAS